MLIYKYTVTFLLLYITSLDGQHNNHTICSFRTDTEWLTNTFSENFISYIIEIKQTDAINSQASYSGHKANHKTSKIKLILLLLFVVFLIIIILIKTILHHQKHSEYLSRIKNRLKQAGYNDNSGTALTINIPDNNKIMKTGSPDKPENDDFHIMACIHQEMTAKHAYREVGLTMDMLAGRLGIHRNKLSKAVNCVSGRNFNQYVNSFRIKEAIQIISGTHHKDLYIDELYEKIGFSNRTSFYRAFKQATGVSPRDFQKHNTHDTWKENEEKLLFHSSLNDDF